MTIIVQVSDFRKNMAMYLGKLRQGHEIELKRGVYYEAKLIRHPKQKETKNKIGKFLKELELLQKNHPFRGGKNLSQKIDKILYGQK